MSSTPPPSASETTGEPAEHATTAHRPGRGRGLARRLLVPLLALAVVWAAGSWYFAGEIHADALGVLPREEPERVPVVAVRPDRVALALTGDAPDTVTRPGTWGLRWDGGYGQVTRILHESESRVVRRFARLTGSPPQVGDRAEVDKAAFGDDPREVLDLDYREVAYHSPLGRFPAWFVPGRGDTWAVLVHGRQAPRSEMLRPLRAVHAAGLPALVPTYRNDPEAAPDPGDLHQFGETEWRDLHGAVEYAVHHGAEDVVLVGASMGGAIVAEFLDSSSLSRVVSGVVLDGPLLDLEAAIDDAATRRTVPLTPVPLPPGLDETAMWLAEQRYGVDMRDLDHTGEVVAADVPLLLVHGTDDETAPVEVSDDVVAARRAQGRPTTYVRVEGASHIAEWNLEPERYDRALDDFVTSVAR